MFPCARWVLAAGLALLSGCTTPVEREAELAALRSAVPPFATFQTLPFEKLPVQTELAFQINRSSPVMEVGPLGRSFVKGFELPAEVGDADIQVNSFMVSGGRVFQPIVTMLNDAMEPIIVTQFSALRTTRVTALAPGWRRELRFRLSGEQRRQVRYLVVHTTREIIELGFALPDEPWQEARTTLIFIPVGGGGGSGQPPTLGSSPSGALSITLLPLAVAR